MIGEWPFEYPPPKKLKTKQKQTNKQTNKTKQWKHQATHRFAIMCLCEIWLRLIRENIITLHF